jgi:hypothetical protein
VINILPVGICQQAGEAGTVYIGRLRGENGPISRKPDDCCVAREFGSNIEPAILYSSVVCGRNVQSKRRWRIERLLIGSLLQAWSQTRLLPQSDTSLIQDFLTVGEGACNSDSNALLGDIT